MADSFSVESEELRSDADTVRNASELAGEQLAKVRRVAASAEPGFPGDAAVPFAMILRRFESFDASLTRNGYSSADRLDTAALLYDKSEDVIEGIFDGIGNMVSRANEAPGR